MKLRHISAETKLIIVVCALLLVANVVLGVVVMNQSGDSLKKLIRRHMLSVSESASVMIDGDELKQITADDVGSDSFNHISDTLVKIKDAQNDMDIKYIYLVKREGDHYVYTIDPDPEDPAEYGEEVVAAPAQDAAWFGPAEIDPVPVEDEWGCYYTSWCSIQDSSGETVGMVGVDFSKDWYDSQMTGHTVIVIIVSALSLLVSVIIISLMVWQMRKRFRKINSELSILSENVESLVHEVSKQSDYDLQNLDHTEEGSDVILIMSEKIHNTQHLLTDYMEYIKAQSFTDDMTGVGNRDAYIDRVNRIKQEIEDGTASFSIAIFDVNSLKSMNDNYGHEFGDRMIIDTARLISEVFGKDQVYRIGGDEFLAVLNSTDEKEMEERFRKLEAAIGQFNSEDHSYPVPLSFAMGSAAYKPGENDNLKEVFKRADMAMYRNKNEYYG